MRYLIDEFKKAATFFTSYSRLMRPVSYTCYENAVEFSTRVDVLRLKIVFTSCAKNSDDIEVKISLINDSKIGEESEWFISKLLMHEDGVLIKFSHVDVNSIYATAIGAHLIKHPEHALSLIELIDKSKDVIPNFINEVNDKELIRAHYQTESNMTTPNENTVTVEQLDDLIERSEKDFAYFGTMTIAVVTLPCGFKLTGQAACVDPANFDKEKGQTYSMQDAKSKLWELEGYRLSNDIHNAKIRSYQGAN